MHLNRDELRAYNDGELGAEAHQRLQVHLDECARCQQQLARLKLDAASLDAQLGTLAPSPAQRPRPEQALARLHARIASEQERSLLTWNGGIMLKRSRLSRNWKRALSGLAAVAVVAIALSFAPVRAAASSLLSVFRLERIVVLPISVQDIERLENISWDLSRDYFPGDVDILTEPGESQHPESLAEASAIAGFEVKAPAAQPPADEIAVRGEMVTRVEPDLEQVQALFEEAELSPDLVPPEIDQQPFVFTVPSSVVQIWGGLEDGGEPLVLMQTPSPSVEFPENVDTDALGVAMLQLMGLSADEAASFSASIDWSTTLLLPVPTDEVTYESVTVDGVEGILLTGTAPDDDSDISYTALLWQKNSVVYLLGGPEGGDGLLEIANSLE